MTGRDDLIEKYRQEAERFIVAFLRRRMYEASEARRAMREIESQVAAKRHRQRPTKGIRHEHKN